MNFKPKLPTGNRPIPLREVMQYVPTKDWRVYRTKIQRDKKWGFMIEGHVPQANRYYVYPKKLREYLNKIYGI